jgi:ketosteroid isomerase-like protein
MGSAALKSQASRDEADIRALIKTIDKAHRDKDAAAIVAPYAQDAVVCDLAPPLSHRGMDLQVKRAWLDTWEGPIDRQSRDFNITVNGEFAFCHGLDRLGGTPKAAGRPISFWNARNGVPCSLKPLTRVLLARPTRANPTIFSATIHPTTATRPSIIPCTNFPTGRCSPSSCASSMRRSLYLSPPAPFMASSCLAPNQVTQALAASLATHPP